MNKAIIIILLIFFTTEGWTQKIKEITHREVNIHFNDSSLKANVLLADKKIHLKNEIDYYWYHNNGIKHNQGDYKGRLLDGGFQVSTKTGILITKGSFKTGNKSGTWKKWNEQGQLKRITNWSKGLKDGKYQKYDNGKLIEEGFYKKNRLNGPYIKSDDGQILEKGKYKKGLLDGKQVVYKSDTIYRTIIYKKGKQVIPKEKKGSEINIEEDVKSKKWWKFWGNKTEKSEEEKIDESSNKKKRNKQKAQIKTEKKEKKQKVKKTGEKKVPKEKKNPSD